MNLGSMGIDSTDGSLFLPIGDSVVRISYGVNASSIASTTANGTYGVGAAVNVTISFSAPVNVTGIPTLSLNSGGTAYYSSGSGTSTLTFAYIVGSGEASSKLDFTSATALALNGEASRTQAAVRLF